MQHYNLEGDANPEEQEAFGAEALLERPENRPKRSQGEGDLTIEKAVSGALHQPQRVYARDGQHREQTLPTAAYRMAKLTEVCFAAGMGEQTFK
jgi:hypothetical protein